jgi:AcrR family transcriptional regulator
MTTSPKPQRMRPDDRRAEILDAARSLLLDAGYASVGLAEIATAGEVSRPSVYRYFPDGRTDVFVAVVEALGEELRDRLRYAAQAPFSAARRLEQLLAALFAFFDETPAAYRLLFRDVWAVGEVAAEDASIAVRALLAAEIAALLVDGGLSDADDVTAASNAVLGAALATVELTVAGATDAERAWRITCDLAAAALPA